jgi:hypothetical protein
MTAPKSLRRRLLFIVSPERMDLYDSLRKALSHESDCEVMIDRRVGARRVGGHRLGTAPDTKDRRVLSRRERLRVDSEIRECGWAVVKITTWPEADRARRAT